MPNNAKTSKRKKAPDVRQNLLRRLIPQGLNITEITEALIKSGIKTSYWTTLRDIDKLQEEIGEDLKKDSTTLNKILAELSLTYDEAIREAWKQYRAAEHPKTKLYAIKIIGDLLEKKIKILQSLGILTQKLGELDNKLEIVWKPPYAYNEIGS